MKQTRIKHYLKKWDQRWPTFLAGALTGVFIFFSAVMIFSAVQKSSLCQKLNCQLLPSISQQQSEQASLGDEAIVIDSELTDLALESIDFDCQDEGQSYQIQKGDSLWKIAERELGSGHRWVEIYQLNQNVIGDNPNLIYPQVVLQLPAS